MRRCALLLILGGSVNNGVNDGLFAFNMNNAPSNSNWNNGASNCYTNRYSLYNAKSFPHPKGRKFAIGSMD